MDQKMVAVISAVTDLICPKWYIPDHAVKKAVRVICFLKSLYGNLIFLVKLPCNPAGNRVKLHTIHFCLVHALRDQTHKVTDTT